MVEVGKERDACSIQQCTFVWKKHVVVGIITITIISIGRRRTTITPRIPRRSVMWSIFLMNCAGSGGRCILAMNYCSGCILDVTLICGGSGPR